MQDDKDEIDFFLDGDQSENGLLRAAKIGWARPAVLTLDEVQELCKALVLLEASTGMLTKSAA